jgi:hypothetical protein
MELFLYKKRKFVDIINNIKPGCNVERDNSYFRPEHSSDIRTAAECSNTEEGISHGHSERSK